MTSGEVAPDGSPVALYLALPFGDAPQIVHASVREGGTILELGCGAGRLTRVLVAYGHDVCAVDNSPEMLEHVTGAAKVCADVFDLTLQRRFDAVVAASHFVDSADPAQRAALLEVCRRHVADDGVVVIQRHDPDWARDPADSSGWYGPVEIDFRLVEHRGATYDAEVTFRVGTRAWTQPFTAAVIEDELLAREAGAAGLRIERFLDDARRWVLLSPV